MAFDERLAARIRGLLDRELDVSEKEMFGGLAFLWRGKMFAGIIHNELMARVGPEQHEAALKKAHTRPMDFTGRPMKGYVFVAPAGLATDHHLEKWVRLCAKFVATLPESLPRPRARKPRVPQKTR